MCPIPSLLLLLLCLIVAIVVVFFGWFKSSVYRYMDCASVYLHCCVTVRFIVP